MAISLKEQQFRDAIEEAITGRAVIYLSELLVEEFQDIPFSDAAKLLSEMKDFEDDILEAVHVFTGKPDYLIGGNFQEYLRYAPDYVRKRIPFVLSHFYATAKLTDVAIKIIEQLFTAVKKMEDAVASPTQQLTIDYFIHIFIPLEKLLNSNTYGSYKIYEFQQYLDDLERRPNDPELQEKLVDYYAEEVVSLIDFIREFLRNRGMTI